MRSLAPLFASTLLVLLPIPRAAAGLPAAAKRAAMTTLTLRRVAVPEAGSVSDARVDSSGRLHVALARGGDAYYARFDPAAAKFSDPVRINSRRGSVVAQGEAGPKLDLGADGTIQVVWHRWNDPVVEVYFTRSTDDGKTFEQERMLGNGLLPNIAIGPRGETYVVWLGDEMGKKTKSSQMAAPLVVTFSADAGRSFVPVTAIPDIPIPCGCCLPDISASDDGSVLIAYRGAEANVRDIHFLRSLYGVYRFRRTLVHPDNWVLNACPNAGPTLALDDSANAVAVAWSSQGISLLASSNDGGRSFAPPDTVPEDAGEIDSYPLSEIDGRGSLGVAWRSAKSTRALLLRDAPTAYFVGPSGIFARE